MHDRDAPSDGEQHLYLLASPLSLFVLETHSVMDGQTDTAHYMGIYGPFTSWPTTVSVKWLAYLIASLNLHLKTSNRIAV